MTVKEKVHYVLTLPAEHKLWFFFSIISSLLTWFTIRFLNAKYLHVFMGHPAGNIMLCTVSSQQQSLKSWRIARVVEAVCRGVPWECKCLTEAICTNILLRFYRIPSVFYLGSMIEKKSPKMLKAHAWLTVGEYCIIGGEVANNGYIVTATFTHPKIQNNREI